MAIVSWIAANWQVVFSGVGAALTGIIAICMVIPGEQPEKALQGVVNFITKFSKKPTDKLE